MTMGLYIDSKFEKIQQKNTEMEKKTAIPAINQSGVIYTQIEIEMNGREQNE